MEKPKRYTVTAALPYANGPIHLGHVAGVYLPADIYVRYLKQQGKDVAFICGSDEHGAAITLRAQKENITPQEIVDTNHGIIQEALHGFGIDFDIYHRTSSELHHETAATFFKELHQKGAFIEQTSQQFYDNENDQFLADRYIMGTCPNCDFEEAYGDQCENCGSTLNPTELINPVSTISGNTPTLKETTHWYLPMDKHEDWLKEWIEQGKLNGLTHHDPKKWRKQVIGQCKSWIDNGLQPRSITRDLNWGVKVPLENSEGKVLYVWFDAPIGYISATKKWAEEQNKNWEDYWKKEDTELVHFLGKDNIVFHCIIFPIILKTHGDYILPTNVPASEFLNLEGKKLSTSRNWAVWLHEYLEDLPHREDELRYVLTSIAPENKDSDFTWKDYQARVNNELVAILGNFVNRSVVLTHKYFEGKVPEQHELLPYDKEVLGAIEQVTKGVHELIEKYKFRDAQAEAMSLARLGNKFLADTEPWKLIKTDAERVATILNISLQLSNALSNILEPFLPRTSVRLKQLLNVSKNNELTPNHQINTASLLFQKVDDDEIEKQIEKLTSAAHATNTKIKPMKETITFDEFTKMDIRSATILDAKKHPNADKLLQLTVDTGIDTRTVVSGIAEHFQPNDVIGKQVTILVNLAPRKIRGVESQGMILMADGNDNNLVFVAPDQSVDNGAEIK